MPSVCCDPQSRSDGPHNGPRRSRSPVSCRAVLNLAHLRKRPNSGGWESQTYAGVAQLGNFLASQTRLSCTVLLGLLTYEMYVNYGKKK
jgi:hypothetical protein